MRKEYALLLLNTSFTEFSSVLASLIVDGRLFIDGSAVVCILHGPCSRVSDRFCGVLTGYMHINMVHSNSILTLSFWYRYECTCSSPKKLLFFQDANSQGAGDYWNASLASTHCYLLHSSCDQHRRISDYSNT